jgi:hypothetical protein
VTSPALVAMVKNLAEKLRLTYLVDPDLFINH